MELSDTELINSYFAGDENSLVLLINRYLKPVYRFAYKYAGNKEEAEDITQEAFVKVWKNLKKFDQTKSFKAWVFSIAKNTAIDFLRKKRNSSFPVFSSFGQDADGENLFEKTIIDLEPLPTELSERGEGRKIISRAVDMLASRYRSVISLRYFNQLTFREMADSLEEPLSTVKSRHRRALLKLRKIFEISENQN